jgi:hypothetical protein
MIRALTGSFGRGAAHSPAALGGLFPTLVTQGTADALLIAVNHRVSETHDEFVRARQDQKISEADFVHWTRFGARWGAFYTEQMNRSIMLDAKDVMESTDGYDAERHELRLWLTSIAPEYTPGPDTTSAASKPPDAWNVNLNLVVAVVGVVAIAYVAGPAVHAWAASRKAAAAAAA